jgi:hypothetical protein
MANPPPEGDPDLSQNRPGYSRCRRAARPRVGRLAASRCCTHRCRAAGSSARPVPGREPLSGVAGSSPRHFPERIRAKGRRSHESGHRRSIGHLNFVGTTRHSVPNRSGFVRALATWKERRTGARLRRPCDLSSACEDHGHPWWVRGLGMAAVSRAVILMKPSLRAGWNQEARELIVPRSTASARASLVSRQPRGWPDGRPRGGHAAG